MKKILLSCFLMPLFFASAQNEVQWTVTGALQPTSVSIRAKLSSPSNSVRAVLSTSAVLAPPYTYSNITAIDSTSNFLVANLVCSGLNANTKYYYTIEADGITDTSANDIATFKTPSLGAHSFTFMAGSCNREPNTKTYNDFPNFDPLFYLNCGDLHYADPNSANVLNHTKAYDERIFNRPLQVEMFRKIPLAYTWDDHDYCGNTDDGQDVAGAVSAGQAYRAYFPHYPFPAQVGTDTNSIYQSFEIGRVKFVVSDLRSQRERNNGTAMGLTQKTWFKNQLLDAKKRNLLICWVGSYSWYGQFDDNWTLNSAERTELSEFMRDSLIENMFIINGDAHMFAIDNGVNGDFTTAGNLPYRYPVLQAGPIENNGSFKGGTYSEGTFYSFFVKAAQYGAVDVIDDGGDSICIKMTGYKKDLTTEQTNELVSYSFCRQIGPYIASNPKLEEGVLSVSIYPNPTTGQFYIRNQESISTKGTIIDMSGRVMSAFELQAGAVLPQSAQSWSNGIYQLILENEKGISYKKIVVQH